MFEILSFIHFKDMNVPFSALTLSIRHGEGYPVGEIAVSIILKGSVLEQME